MKVAYKLGWDGLVYSGTHATALGFDTETTVTDVKGEWNELVLAVASDGVKTQVLHPDDLVKFLWTHRDVPFSCHNAAFDFWMVERFLRVHGSERDVKSWWKKCEDGLLHCSMLLDMLVRLARGEGEKYAEDVGGFRRRNLDEVSQAYAGFAVDKTDPYRMRYGEIQNKNFKDVTDKGFFDYAAVDAYAQAKLWPGLHAEAKCIADRFARAYLPDPAKRACQWDRWGLLTERIQVLGAVALAKVEKNGLPFCPDRAVEDETKTRASLAPLLEEIRALRPNFFKKNKDGKEIVSGKAKVPSVNNADLEQALHEASARIATAVPEFEAPKSTGKLQGISRSAEDWEPFAPYDPFLAVWTRLGALTKRLGFHAMFHDDEPKVPKTKVRAKKTEQPTLFDEPVKENKAFGGPMARRTRVYTKYEPLLRTGRTSSTSPNLQNQPKCQKFRAIFKAPAGKKLVSCDYAAIELKTLAAVCMERLGRSVMADVIREGKWDLHCYTAAKMTGRPVEEIQAEVAAEKKAKKANPDAPTPTSDLRQKNKAIAFGCPGGLAGPNLQEYAQKTYGVVMTLAEASEARRGLIEDIYPELNDKDGYLADTTLRSVAVNSGLTYDEVLSVVGRDYAAQPWTGRVLAKIAGGGTKKANGEPYNERLLGAFRDILYEIGVRSPKGCLSDETRTLLTRRASSAKAADELCLSHAVTTTGRIRTKVRYTVSKNTPFQGLAADGAKLALFRMIKESMCVVGFVHDEMIVEIEDKGEDENNKTGDYVRRVMCEEMDRVLMGHTVSEAEATVSDHWSK